MCSESTDDKRRTACQDESTTGGKKWLQVMPKRKIIVLLTATVNPGATPFVVRADPTMRLRDYRMALDNWVAQGNFTRLIVCENSGADLSVLKQVAASRRMPDVYFISYVDGGVGEKRGKGYAELLEIERALGCDVRIEREDIVIKCTGRLQIKNAARLLTRITTLEFDVMCDLRKYLTIADSRIFAATREFLEDYLIPRREMINDSAGVYFEHALAMACVAAVADGKAWRPFPVLPEIIGISGSTGRSMTDSWIKRLAKRIYCRLNDRILRR
jgi:hypothetical protein